VSILFSYLALLIPVFTLTAVLLASASFHPASDFIMRSIDLRCPATLFFHLFAFDPVL
jgi:hypothetical protein